MMSTPACFHVAADTMLMWFVPTHARGQALNVRPKAAFFALDFEWIIVALWQVFFTRKQTVGVTESEWLVFRSTTSHSGYAHAIWQCTSPQVRLRKSRPSRTLHKPESHL
jgi:hypothetical protein